MTHIRNIQLQEIPVLDDFLYAAIFISQGVEPPPRSVGKVMNKSLSVQKANYALRMYQKAGFEIVEERGDEVLMRARL